MGGGGGDDKKLGGQKEMFGGQNSKLGVCKTPFKGEGGSTRERFSRIEQTHLCGVGQKGLGS